jgi:hypothetical protein
MTTLDRSPSPLPHQTRALAWAKRESSLIVGERGTGERYAAERRSLPKPATAWSRAGAPQSGWHAYRPDAGALPPGWAVELAVTIERPLTSSNDTTAASRALLLARAAGPWHPVAHAFRTASWEVESIAGIGPALPGLHVCRSRPEPGLDPLPRRAVLVHLRGASERGQAIGHRRRHAHETGIVTWEPGAGAVLTCTGRVGVSAQAVVAIAGNGELLALRPPPGGATVLRAWRCRRACSPPGRAAKPDHDWALAVGVVLASAMGSGLGRVARRYAVTAQDAGWSATVLTGSAALEIARAGDPRYPPPTTIARPVSRAAVMEMVNTCLTFAAGEAAYPPLPAD